jgi:UrcA family protein
MNKPRFNLHRLALGAVAATMLAAPLTQATTLPSQRVYVGDLDLSSDRGQRQLQRRVSQAVEKVCARPSTRLMHSTPVRRSVRSCQQQAWEGVRFQLARSGVKGDHLALRVRSADVI